MGMDFIQNFKPFKFDLVIALTNRIIRENRDLYPLLEAMDKAA